MNKKRKMKAIVVAILMFCLCFGGIFSGMETAKAADTDPSRFFYSDVQYASLNEPQFYQLKIDERMAVKFTVKVWVQMGVHLSIYKGTDISAEPAITKLFAGGWSWIGAQSCFRDSAPIMLDPGTYTVKVMVQNDQKYGYILELSDNNGGTPKASAKLIDPDKDPGADKNDSDSAKTPKLSKKSVTLTVGSKVTLKVKNASGKITWSSSNKKVAPVSSKGVVTAKKAGKATITAKTTKGKKLTCKVTVKSKKK